MNSFLKIKQKLKSHLTSRRIEEMENKGNPHPRCVLNARTKLLPPKRKEKKKVQEKARQPEISLRYFEKTKLEKNEPT